MTLKKIFDAGGYPGESPLLLFAVYNIAVSCMHYCSVQHSSFLHAMLQCNI